MFRQLRRTLTLLAALSLLGSATVSAVPQTVGLFLNTPNAFQGYTLFMPRGWPVTYLIDMEGQLVHSWQHTHEPRNVAYLLENGHLLRAAWTPNDVFFTSGSGGLLQEWDWDGALVWEFLYSNDEICGHHDIDLLPNGNLLVVAWEYKTREEAISAGRDPEMLRDALWPGHVVEIERVGSAGANIVWEWHAWDHLIQNFDPTKENFGVVADHPGLIDINKMRDDREDWLHINTVEYNADLDQIVLSSNRLQEIWVIDHSTTTEEAAGHTGGARGMGGDLLYRWGNPAMYDRGTEEDQRLFTQHNVQWIESGYPGEGHLLVFNNGRGRWPGGLSYSSIEEFVTPVDENGDYPIPPPGEPHGPTEALWTYVADPSEEFFTGFFGGVQRQPNGNTLIIESVEGRIFEIDSSEEIVWEYIIPVGINGPVGQGLPPIGNASFRAPRFAPDYPAFDGRDLKPKGPIELDVTAVADGALEPVPYSLGQNYPNPFHPATTIAFSLRDPAPVALDIYSIGGRHIVTVMKDNLGVGEHRYMWRANQLPSGVYAYTLRVGSRTATRKMVLVK